MACGKSLVADMLARLGATVVDTDVISRELMQPGTDMLAQVVARWGTDMLEEDGSLNRKRLGQQVFGDEAATAELNRITHGAIMATLKGRLAEATTEVAVAVIPLLFETGAQRSVDEVWLVAAPHRTQMDRILARDGLSSTEASQRLERQWSLEKKRPLAQVVIENTGSLQELQGRVEAAWQHLLQELKDGGRARHRAQP